MRMICLLPTEACFGILNSYCTAIGWISRCEPYQTQCLRSPGRTHSATVIARVASVTAAYLQSTLCQTCNVRVYSCRIIDLPMQPCAQCRHHKFRDRHTVCTIGANAGPDGLLNGMRSENRQIFRQVCSNIQIAEACMCPDLVVESAPTRSCVSG